MIELGDSAFSSMPPLGIDSQAAEHDMEGRDEEEKQMQAAIDAARTNFGSQPSLRANVRTAANFSVRRTISVCGRATRAPIQKVRAALVYGASIASK